MTGWWFLEASRSECRVRSEALEPVYPILCSTNDYRNSLEIRSNSCYQITVAQWCLKITTMLAIVFVLIPTIDPFNAIEFVMLEWIGRLIKLQVISH